ncbi:hypothetical protein [Flagellimonas eckloniae]|uniref:hypothetical protein n=1 Tax=Flagellimonas eckloniae TaxID=346185 RepID=UPI00111211BB|nr:hypothetical protein [Allomuricauda eckloniae]
MQWATRDVAKISCNDLTFDEANRIIEKLGGTPHKHASYGWGMFDKNNHQHKTILALCMNYGWKKLNPKSGRDIADIAALGNWLHNDPRCPVRKPLKQMEPKETSKIIAALENMVARKYK